MLCRHSTFNFLRKSSETLRLGNNLASLFVCLRQKLANGCLESTNIEKDYANMNMSGFLVHTEQIERDALNQPRVPY